MYWPPPKEYNPSSRRCGQEFWGVNRHQRCVPRSLCYLLWKLGSGDPDAQVLFQKGLFQPKREQKDQYRLETIMEKLSGTGMTKKK